MLDTQSILVNLPQILQVFCTCFVYLDNRRYKSDYVPFICPVAIMPGRVYTHTFQTQRINCIVEVTLSTNSFLRIKPPLFDDEVYRGTQFRAADLTFARPNPIPTVFQQHAYRYRMYLVNMDVLQSDSFVYVMNLDLHLNFTTSIFSVIRKLNEFEDEIENMNILNPYGFRTKKYGITAYGVSNLDFSTLNEAVHKIAKLPVHWLVSLEKDRADSILTRNVLVKGSSWIAHMKKVGLGYKTFGTGYRPRVKLVLASLLVQNVTVDWIDFFPAYINSFVPEIWVEYKPPVGGFAFPKFNPKRYGFITCSGAYIDNIPFLKLVSAFTVEVWVTVLGLIVIYVGLEAIIFRSAKITISLPLLLLEQSFMIPSADTSTFKLSAYRWVLSTWCILAILLSNAYKGENVSSLTNPLSVLGPSSWSTVVENKYIIHSTIDDMFTSFAEKHGINPNLSLYMGIRDRMNYMRNISYIKHTATVCSNCSICEKLRVLKSTRDLDHMFKSSFYLFLYLYPDFARLYGPAGRQYALIYDTGSFLMNNPVVIYYRRFPVHRTGDTDR